MTNTKVTVYITERNMLALQDIASLEGHSLTDTINRALYFYFVLRGDQLLGKNIYVGNIEELSGLVELEKLVIDN